MHTDTTKPLSKKAQREQDKQEAIRELRRLLPPGTTVYTTVDHVAKSGMMRAITVRIPRRNQPLNITHLVALACGWKRHPKHDGVKVGGCGMDMGFHVVNTLSYVIHGYKDKGDGAAPETQGRPFAPRRGHYRAGYSLIQRWM